MVFDAVQKMVAKVYNADEPAIEMTLIHFSNSIRKFSILTFLFHVDFRPMRR